MKPRSKTTHLPKKVTKTKHRAQRSTSPIKGVTCAAWTEQGYKKLNPEGLKSLGVNYVSIPVTWYQAMPNSSEVLPTNKTPTDSSLISIIKKIRNLGIDVMLKPHIDIMYPETGWRGVIEPQDWEAWSKRYTEFVMHYVSIAQKREANMFCIGTELLSTAIKRPEFWKKLIADVRKKYKGQIVYAANWYGEYPYLEFWDALDYVGVNAFFPLSTESKPTKTALMKFWEKWANEIEQWQDRILKPVIFTEAGYKSCFGAASRPWEWNPEGKVDYTLQADCYDALLETFWNKPWFRGVFWWYWDAIPRPDPKRDFACKGKKAEKVLSKWYKTR